MSALSKKGPAFPLSKWMADIRTVMGVKHRHIHGICGLWSIGLQFWHTTVTSNRASSRKEFCPSITIPQVLSWICLLGKRSQERVLIGLLATCVMIPNVECMLF